MEKILHKADERGEGAYGWLSTRYSFSFAQWCEPSRMGFGALRVINDDHIAPHSGFAMHAHEDMEIITLVTAGVLTHKDSMGNTGTIRAGEVQVMSAGTGIVHSEYNESDEPLALFQIWITPKERGIQPRYVQRSFAEGDALLVGPEGTPGALAINQNAYVVRVVLDGEGLYVYRLHNPENGLYVLVVEGEANVADQYLGNRDGLGVTSVESILLKKAGAQRATVLLFEVPMQSK